jgi:hypothetical protein
MQAATLDDVIDYESVKQLYTERLTTLYDNIEKWLDGEKFTFQPSKEFFEEGGLGQYEAPVLRILSQETQKQIVVIRPAGAMIIAAEGRVDIVGDFDKESLIYLLPMSGIVASVSYRKGMEPPHTERKKISMFSGFEDEGWYWIEIRRLAKVRKVTSDLFKLLINEVCRDTILE